MLKIPLDTSSIVFALQNGIDIFLAFGEQLDAIPIISNGVIRELRNLSLRRTKQGNAARLAAQLIELHRVAIASDKRSFDEWVLAPSMGFEQVCTNDLALKKGLRIKGIKVISVSKKGILK